jgi:flagellar L-ring protein FlgH
MKNVCIILSMLTLFGCGTGGKNSAPPGLTPITRGAEHQAMIATPLPEQSGTSDVPGIASLWSGGRESLLGDRRAETLGDILTVVIEIDDKAEISNNSQRNRSSSENLGISDFFGIPEAIEDGMGNGASLAPAVSVTGGSKYSGGGSVRRNEKLTLRVAATITNVLPNGVLEISGSQEVRVNFEIRELIVTGYVRPEDISRKNEIPYDKIASARISYGGRGAISNAQQSRYGQQAVDSVLPF